MNTRAGRLAIAVLIVALAGVGLWLTQDDAHTLHLETTSPPTESPHLAPLRPAAVDESALDSRVPDESPVHSEVNTETVELQAWFYSPEDRVPAAHVPFLFGTRHDGGSPSITITTDAVGRASFSLPSVFREAEAGAWYDTDMPSVFDGPFPLQIPPPMDGATHLELSLLRGVLVEGQLLGPDDAAVSGRVESWSLTSDGPIFDAEVATSKDGRFSFPVIKEGPLRLLGRGGHHGSYDLGNGAVTLGIVFTDPPPEQIIHLNGPGTIRGRLVDENGNAVRRTLTVIAATDDEPVDFEATRAARDLAHEGRGHTYIEGATTRADGSLTVEGMRVALYHVGAPIGSYALRSMVRLTDEPIPADGVVHEWTLRTPRLVIDVVDENGDPPSLDLKALAPSPHERRPWPKHPVITASYAGARATETAASGVFLQQLSWSTLGTCEAPVAPNSEIDVCIYGGDVALTHRRVVIPPDAGEVRTSIVLEHGGDVGELHVDVVGPDGARLIDASGKIVVRVIDVETGVELTAKRASHDDLPITLTLPSSRYTVVVEGTPVVRFGLPLLIEPRRLGAFETQVDVAPGAAVFVEAALSLPAFLHLTLSGSPSSFERERFDASPNSRSDVNATVVLARSDRMPARVDFITAAPFGEDSQWLVPQLPLGTSATSEALTPGRYTLVVRTPSGRERRRDVTLVAGRTLNVTLDFD